MTRLRRGAAMAGVVLLGWGLAGCSMGWPGPAPMYQSPDPFRPPVELPFAPRDLPIQPEQLDPNRWNPGIPQT
ncbi:MAG: hypothetical protein OEV94_04530 [Deltaproteobacteria bacterium]|nr:hypothetical protein [Deltaproteobacteria bacterium]